MAVLDWLIILAYLGTVLGLAVWVFSKRKDTPDDYFLAGRNLSWFIVGASTMTVGGTGSGTVVVVGVVPVVVPGSFSGVHAVSRKAARKRCVASAAWRSTCSARSRATWSPSCRTSRRSHASC